MRRPFRPATFFAYAVAALAISGALAMRPLAASAAETDVGLLIAVFAGTHIGSDNPDPQHGIVPGALLEGSEQIGRFGAVIEGIPQVGVTGSSTGQFGQSKATLELLNSYLTAAIDPARLVRVGIGTQLINLTNSNGTNGDVNQARVFSLLLHADGTLPLKGDRAIELGLNVIPNVRTDLHVFNYMDEARLDKPEAGAEEDVSLDYRWKHGPLVYRAGIRGIDYSTRNTRTGEEVDRNVGEGLTFDVRYAFGHP